MKREKDENEEYIRMMIGSGLHSSFVKFKKGERVMLDDGTFVEAGLSLEESRERLNKRIDEIVEGKSNLLVKKLTRKR